MKIFSLELTAMLRKKWTMDGEKLTKTKQGKDNEIMNSHFKLAHKAKYSSNEIS